MMSNPKRTVPSAIHVKHNTSVLDLAVLSHGLSDNTSLHFMAPLPMSRTLASAPCKDQETSSVLHN